MDSEKLFATGDFLEIYVHPVKIQTEVSDLQQQNGAMCVMIKKIQGRRLT
jgi:hypothetical protein